MRYKRGMFGRTLSLVACLALVTSCDDDAPKGRPSGPSDAMWKLAPEGTVRAIVISPYGLAMLEKGFTSLLAYFAKAGPEMAPIEGQLDTLLEQVGGKNFTLASLGLTSSKGAAMFGTNEGMVAVLPIADRAAFVAKVHGKVAATPEGIDEIDKVRCKMIGALYTCASSLELLDKVGKSSIKDKLTPVRARGDIEIVANEVPLEGPSMPRSTLAAAIELESGAWVVRGLLNKPPAAMMSKLTASSRPRTTVGSSSGFAMIDIRQIIEPTDDKVVEGITQADLVKAVSGPLTLDVAGGSTIFDIQIPLSNPAPLQKVVEKCGEIPALAGIAKFEGGVCKLDLQQLNTALDMWVDGSVLHLGKKGAPITPVKIPMSPAARELANGQWGLAFWGRGTMFAPTGKPATEVPQVPPLLAIQLRVLSAIDEIGFGVKQDGDALRFVLGLRTTFADPQAVVDALAAISAADIASNRAEAKSKPIVDAHPRSQFAIDHAAGQHGILIPAQLFSAGVSGILPAIFSYLRGGKEPPIASDEPAQEQPKPGQISMMRVVGYATQAYAVWKEKNPGKACPASMAELGKAVAEEAELRDEWGHELILKCGKDLPAAAKGQPIVIESWGFDGKPDTADDLKSYVIMGSGSAEAPAPETPTPAPTPAPAPTGSATPAPTGSATPAPTGSATPAPTAPTPAPTAPTPTPAPTAPTPTPVPAPTGSATP